MKKLLISSVEDTIVDIVDGDKYFEYQKVNVKAEDLLKVIQERLGNDMSEVEEIYINVGPGSFTGIRAGLALITGLTVATKIKVIPFTTFDMFEYNKLTAKEILAVNGFSNFVYIKYIKGKKSYMQCLEIEKLMEIAKNATVYSYSDKIIKKLSDHSIKTKNVSISPKNVLIKQANGTLDNIKAEPIYLRLSQAELQKKENQK